MSFDLPGSMPMCWEGHRLVRQKRRKCHPTCSYCETEALHSSTVLVCKKCDLVCSILLSSKPFKQSWPIVEPQQPAVCMGIWSWIRLMCPCLRLQTVFILIFRPEPLQNLDTYRPCLAIPFFEIDSAPDLYPQPLRRRKPLKAP